MAMGLVELAARAERAQESSVTDAGDEVLDKHALLAELRAAVAAELARAQHGRQSE